jgi:NTE family protein
MRAPRRSGIGFRRRDDGDHTMDTRRTILEVLATEPYRFPGHHRAGVRQHLRRGERRRDEAVARSLASALRYTTRLGRSVAAALARWQPWAAYRALTGRGDGPPTDPGTTGRADTPPIAGSPCQADAKRAAAGRRGRATAAPEPSIPPPLTVSLALQGGGAHGAFTWGVLDRLLEDGRIAFEGVSGTSAGAVNAALLVSGWLADGRDGASRALDGFWRRLPDLVPPAPLQPALGLLTKNLSPYQFNPLDLNPLRPLLAELIDFAAIRRADVPRLFVAATGVRTGAGRIFRNPEMSAEVVLASGCLPSLHRAVEIDGEAYWDGGFSSNPPLLPLVEHCRARDLLLVQLSPSEVDGLPVTAPDIRGRMGQIVFNAPLLHELRALELDAPRARVRPPRIDATPVVTPLGAESAARPDRDLLRHLREAGRAAADGWLAALGRPAAAGVRAA